VLSKPPRQEDKRKSGGTAPLIPKPKALDTGMVPVSRPDRFTNGDRTQIPTEQEEEQATESVSWKRDKSWESNPSPSVVPPSLNTVYPGPCFPLGAISTERHVHVSQKH
jgi:hypothetical protein